MQTFTVLEDGVIPDWAKKAIKAGSAVEVLTSIGWVKLSKSEVEFRNSLTYRVI